MQTIRILEAFELSSRVYTSYLQLCLGKRPSMPANSGQYDGRSASLYVMQNSSSNNTTRELYGGKIEVGNLPKGGPQVQIHFLC